MKFNREGRRRVIGVEEGVMREKGGEEEVRRERGSEEEVRRVRRGEEEGRREEDGEDPSPRRRGSEGYSSDSSGDYQRQMETILRTIRIVKKTRNKGRGKVLAIFFLLPFLIFVHHPFLSHFLVHCQIKSNSNSKCFPCKCGILNNNCSLKV